MKKVILAMVVSVVFAISSFAIAGNAEAASCNTSYIFKVYVKQSNGSYQHVLTSTSANYVISQIEANPSLSGYVKGRDQICDGFDFWSFSNGTWRMTRDG